jgi:hypothetical protein
VPLGSTTADGMDEATAATTIQRVARGHLARKSHTGRHASGGGRLSSHADTGPNPVSPGVEQLGSESSQPPLAVNFEDSLVTPLGGATLQPQENSSAATAETEAPISPLETSTVAPLDSTMRPAYEDSLDTRQQ